MSESWRPPRLPGERMERAARSMIPGTFDGRVANAAPTRVPDRGSTGGDDGTRAIFSWAGVPTAGEESPPYYNTTPNADLGTMIIATRSNTTGPTTVALLNGGTQIATITLAAGEKKAEQILDLTAEYSDLLTVKATAVGGGLSGLTIVVLIED